MTSAAKLIQASLTTRLWLQTLRRAVPQLDYAEARNWAKFKRGDSRAIAQLNPSKKSIRLFLPLAPESDQDLEPSPSSGTWKKRFRSVFRIASEGDLAKAAILITNAASLLHQEAKGNFTRRPDLMSAEEVEAGSSYQEGSVRQVTVNAYERNQEAREACLRHYGRSCTVCNINFLEVYGDEARDFIHVHHVRPIARAGGTYVLNPITDLRPVCPNCHGVIHRRDPPFEIEEVKQMLASTCAKD